MAQTRFFSLRARLLLLVGLAVLPLFAVVVYDSLRQRQESLAAAQRQAQELAETAALQQQLIFGHTQQILSSLAKTGELYTGKIQGKCAELGTEWLRRFPYYINFGLIAPDGTVLCSVVPFKGAVNLADRDYFRQARDSRDFAIGRYQTGRITGKPTVNAAYPLVSEGRLVYVAYLAIDLSWLNTLLSHIQLPPDSNVALIDNEGTVLAAYPPDTFNIGQSLPDFPRLRAAMALGPSSVTEWIDEAQIERATLLHALDSTSRGSTFLTLSTPKRRLYAEANRMLGQRLAWLGLALASVLAAAWLGSDVLILRKLRRLNAAILDFGQGDLSARTGLAPAADELGTLAKSFDHMAHRLQQQEEKLQQAITELGNVNRALHLLSAGNRTLLHAKEETALLQAMCRVAVEKGHYLMAWVAIARTTKAKPFFPWRTPASPSITCNGSASAGGITNSGKAP